mmetsp:Transcript_89559/g.123618  ORF Transcript_89559/g.123618 Transcript_89559/m.123618 type:complete len:128 (+) Transcript_89559:123-506(+)
MDKSFEELANNAGYRVESYTVETEDGYLLGLFRIPGTLDEELPNVENIPDLSSKPPILFQHGLTDSADAWIVHDSDKAPGFIAASQGYDVWLSNFRGNKYSRAHKYLNPNVDASYWRFSFKEYSDYD